MLEHLGPTPTWVWDVHLSQDGEPIDSLGGIAASTTGCNQAIQQYAPRLGQNDHAPAVCDWHTVLICGYAPKGDWLCRVGVWHCGSLVQWQCLTRSSQEEALGAGRQLVAEAVSVRLAPPPTLWAQAVQAAPHLASVLAALALLTAVVWWGPAVIVSFATCL